MEEQQTADQDIQQQEAPDDNEAINNEEHIQEKQPRTKATLQSGQRVSLTQQSLDPFTSCLRGVFIESQQPSERPPDWKYRGLLSLIRFDYCSQNYWIQRSKIKMKVSNDTYEDFMTGNTLELLRTLSNSPILEICEVVGQIALPNSFNFKVPMYSFESGQDISTETNFISICQNSVRIQVHEA
ncbi:MAG: hypothetical protein EZS28_018646 [Streblomastix strix]|uniref:Uncharacterized protein n=1 Tax=Streblomastix strix TaxID=222440 RepID=A0A5J4VTD8_9EUKA|nr:MAG: hypothetical protein EZS28_018646 [Streblomastix strix]